MPKTRRPVDPRQKAQHAEISFAEQPLAAAFVQAIATGTDRPKDNEILCLGTRGDGKTIRFMTGAIEHARAHHAAGYPLPVPWMAVTDTFTSHKLKTNRSFEIQSGKAAENSPKAITLRRSGWQALRSSRWICSASKIRVRWTGLEWKPSACGLKSRRRRPSWFNHPESVSRRGYSQCFDIITTCSISLILSATLVVRRQLAEISFPSALSESPLLQPLTPGLSLR